MDTTEHFLTPEQRQTLVALHKRQREWCYSYNEVADILLLDDSTIRRYIATYTEHGTDALLSDSHDSHSNKLAPERAAVCRFCIDTYFSRCLSCNGLH